MLISLCFTLRWSVHPGTAVHVHCRAGKDFNSQDGKLVHAAQHGLLIALQPMIELCGYHEALATVIIMPVGAVDLNAIMTST